MIGLVGVLAALAVAYQATTQSQARMFNALTARIAGQNAVDAAVDLGVWRIVRDWRKNPESLERIDLRCARNGSALSVTIENESRRLNVNFADEDALAREIANAGLATEKALAIARYIVDYVDRDGIASDGAPEAERFSAAGAVSPPKNAPLNLIEELRLIPGVDEETFGVLQKALSAHSTRSGRRRRQQEGRDAEETAPRGVYRVTAIAVSADGRSPLFGRIAVVDLDPARPQSPAIRVWSRGAVQSAAPAGPSAPASDCRDLILRE